LKKRVEGELRFWLNNMALAGAPEVSQSGSFGVHLAVHALTSAVKPAGLLSTGALPGVVCG